MDMASLKMSRSAPWDIAWTRRPGGSTLWLDTQAWEPPRRPRQAHAAPAVCSSPPAGFVTNHEVPGEIPGGCRGRGRAGLPIRSARVSAISWAGSLQSLHAPPELCLKAGAQRRPGGNCSHRAGARRALPIAAELPARPRCPSIGEPLRPSASGTPRGRRHHSMGDSWQCRRRVQGGRNDTSKQDRLPSPLRFYC